MRRCAKPVIAAVEGNAAGAGFSMALAADFVVASRIARFAVAHVRLGISPDGGITAALPRMLPAPLANELLLLGKPVSAERLHAVGLVNSLAEPGQAVEAATRMAHDVARGAIGAMGRIKQLVNSATWAGLDAQLEAERRHFVEAMFGDEAREGVNAFVEKRPADFARCLSGR
jgi:enoyl-CoA hydratase/carnithine racemase